MPEKNQLANELRMYLQIEKYIIRPKVTNPEIERIIRDRKEENRQRKTRLIEMAKEMLEQTDYYAAGQQLNISAGEPITAICDALDYLVDNSFNKMGYIEHPCNDPIKEIQAVLRSNDIGQQSLNLSLPEYNPKATNEVREYVDLCTKTSKQIVIHDLIAKRFSNRPYGWPDWETMLILARLIVAGEIQFVMHGDILETKRVYEQISKTSNWRKITIKQRRMVDSQLLEQTRKLGQEVFGQMGPDSEDGLFNFFKEKLSDWQSRLREYKTLADTGNYPGTEEIAEGLRHISVLLNDKESYIFINRLKDLKSDLLNFAEEFHDIDNFYKNQRPVWEKLIKIYEKFLLNKFELERDPDAIAAFRRMEDILHAPAPYELIKDADMLISKVAHYNDQLVAEYRKRALAVVDKLLAELNTEIDKVCKDKDVVDSFKNARFLPFNTLKSEIASQDSIAHLQQIEQRASTQFTQQMQMVAEYVQKISKESKPDAPKPVVKPIVSVKTSSVAQKAYLETQQDVDEFVNKLKEKLSQEIAKNNRIRID